MVTTRDCLCKFRKVVNDDQNAGVVVVRGADFQVVILDQLVEIATLNVFQLKSYITGFVAHLLTGEALADISADTAPYAGPGVALLNSSNHLSDALMSHGVVRTEQDFMLI